VVGVVLLIALMIVMYLVDRFGPRRNQTRRTNVLRATEIPAAIATKKGVVLAIIVLALVGVFLGFYPKSYWLIIFYGILGYVGFLVPFVYRLTNRNKGPL
jgi:MFS family permease